MSLYADYIKERLGKGIIERPEGFATYVAWSDGIYIEDIYVSPDSRHSNVASAMADEIAAIAKEKGFSRLYGSVKPSANWSTISMKVLLAYGFEIHSAGNDAIILVKGI